MEKINRHNYEAFLLDYLEGNLDEADRAELEVFAITHPDLDIDLDSVLPVFEPEGLSIDFKAELKKTEADLLEEELISYLENQLPEEKRKAFELKLLQNRELAADYAQLKKTILAPDAKDVLADKASLHKTEDDFVLNNRVLAYYENQLAGSGRAEFEAELNASQSLQKDLALVANTRLVADASIVYPGKAGLKKESRVVALFSRRTMAALAAAILLLLGLGLVINYYTGGPAAVKPGLASKNIQPVDTAVHHKGQAPVSPVITAPQPASSPALLAHSSPSASKMAQRETKAVAMPAEEPTNNPVAEQAPKQVEQAPKQELAPTVENGLAKEEQKPENQIVTHPDATSIEPASTSQLAVLEEDDDSDAAPVKTKSGFWHQAVKLARRANHLGITAVDGNENSKHDYSLSFNAFSVEKH